MNFMNSDHSYTIGKFLNETDILRTVNLSRFQSDKES